MTDPYKILNVSPTASDDEVKRAYRELARKYHPDNYHDNPLADLAQEKMKEINEAYETIQKQRKGSAATSSYGYGSQGGYGSSGDPLMQKVRAALSRGDVMMAEQLLASAPNHTAEWNFLMSIVCYRRGWLDEAKRYYETAAQMEPDNAEYRQAVEFMARGGRGQAQGDVFGTDTCISDGLCCPFPFFCLPCFCC